MWNFIFIVINMIIHVFKGLSFLYLFIPYVDIYFVGVFRAEECHHHV